MLQSSDDFKVLFIQPWCFKHPSLPPPPPKKIFLQSTMFYPKDTYQKQMVVKLFFKNGPSICIVNV